MGISSSMLFIIIPVILIIAGVWLLYSSTHQKTDKQRQKPRAKRNVDRNGRSKKFAKQRASKVSEEFDADDVLGLKSSKPLVVAVEDESKSYQSQPQTKNQSETLQSSMKCPDVVSFYLFAEKDKPYTGYELLQALLAVGLRFGAMNIFHRHESKSGQGEVLFSLASAVAPGTFELAKMGSFASPALCLVLKPKKVADPLLAFDLMIDTAKQLVDDLGGKLLDDKRQPLTDVAAQQIRCTLQVAVTT